jgi:hypothetical protein
MIGIVTVGPNPPFDLGDKVGALYHVMSECSGLQEGKVGALGNCSRSITFDLAQNSHSCSAIKLRGHTPYHYCS